MTNKEIVLAYLKNKRFVRTNLLFWLVLYLFFMLLQYSGSQEGNYNGYLEVTIVLPLFTFIFYCNFFLCALFFIKRKVLYFLFNIILLAIFLALFVSYDDISKTQALRHYTRITAVLTILAVATFYYIIIILISTSYWSVTYASAKAKETMQIQIRLQHMENEKVIAEKQFLQSQINPHFLYNTLNFFYAKSLTLSPELAESVLLLSNIMRYSLEKNENKMGMVYLEDEIAHINNVIKINQFRFSNKLQIQFLIAGNTDGIRIVPLVLITLVENAFKHGEMLDAAFPVTITLTMDETKQVIDFIVKNKKRTGPKETGTGIGLENTKRRLEFAYGANNTLILKDEEGFYTASLQLPLFKDAE